jgi:hypothetical protein
MTEAARVCEVGEPADDSTPDEALEWQRWVLMTVVLRCSRRHSAMVVARPHLESSHERSLIDFPCPDLGTRVPVGLLCAPIYILVVHLGAGLGGESSTGLTSTGSSSTMVTPSPPSLKLSAESTVCLIANG